jgi:hypothetical protein
MCKLWAIGLIAAGAVAWCGDTRSAAQDRKKATEADMALVKGTLASVDTEKNTVTVTIHKFDRANQQPNDMNKTFTLTKEAKILQDDAAAKLGDLKKGNPVLVKLDGANAASVSVDGGTSQGEFFSANLERNTITVIAGRNMSKQVCHLLKTTKVTGSDSKALAVADLKQGMKLALTRSVEDDHTVIRIQVQAAAGR